MGDVKAAEEKLLDIIHNKQGITQEELRTHFEGNKFTPVELEALNNVVASGRVTLLVDNNNKLSYKEISPEEAIKFRDLTAIDKNIYQLIEASKEKGMWTKDIRSQTNLQVGQISKSLKVLMTRKLIKEVKAKKKVYILFNLTPSREGVSVWYNESGQFDIEKIENLQEEVMRVIQEKMFANVEEIAESVQKAGFDVQLADVQVIINTLIYDGLADETKDPRPGARRNSPLYRPMRLSRPDNGFVDIPCGKCPVFDLCSGSGDISPEKCVYYTSWIDEF